MSYVPEQHNEVAVNDTFTNILEFFEQFSISELLVNCTSTVEYGSKLNMIYFIWKRNVRTLIRIVRNDTIAK